VYWDLEVCILQLQLHHPVCRLDYVWEQMKTLHLEVLHLYKIVEIFEVFALPLSSPPRRFGIYNLGRNELRLWHLFGQKLPDLLGDFGLLF